jgi:hypothetical protein
VEELQQALDVSETTFRRFVTISSNLVWAGTTLPVDQ